MKTNFFKSKVFIITLIAAIVLTLVPTLIAAFGGVDLLRSFAGTVAKPFNYVGSSIANAFNGFVSVFTEYDALKEENAALKAELEEYKDREYENNVIRDQNEWLKDYLNFRNTNPDLVLTDARVIAREAGNYATVLTLDKGSISGIKKNMPVIVGSGLLGHVSEVGVDWCKVTTITEATGSIGVYTGRNNAKGLLRGDPTLYEDGLCKLSYVESTDVQIGDRIYTSGGTYPSGIFIGEVTQTGIDPTTGEIIATVTPDVDMTALDDVGSVMIICGKKQK